MSEHEADVLLWSEHQAELLRRLAAGERVNDQVDWENVSEEVESVGSEQLHVVQSLLRRALIPLLKAQAWPLWRDAATWRAGVVRLRADATDRFAPSMRQRIALARIYRQALRALPEMMDGEPPQPVPESCPLTLGELLEED